MNSPKILQKRTVAIATLTEMITRLVKAVVKHPEQANITHSVHGALIALVISVHPDDVRRVVGAQGKHIKALNILAGEFSLRNELEAHIAIDDRNPSTRPAIKEAWTPAVANKNTLKSLEKLLYATIMPFADKEDGDEETEIASTTIGPLTILEVKVPLKYYLCVSGHGAQFDYGVEGHVIGSIKNIFDGIAKNQGMMIRITLTQV